MSTRVTKVAKSDPPKVYTFRAILLRRLFGTKPLVFGLSFFRRAVFTNRGGTDAARPFLASSIWTLFVFGVRVEPLYRPAFSICRSASFGLRRSPRRLEKVDYSRKPSVAGLELPLGDPRPFSATLSEFGMLTFYLRWFAQTTFWVPENRPRLLLPLSNNLRVVFEYAFRDRKNTKNILLF